MIRWQARPVSIRLRRPSAADLAALLERCRDDTLTYTPVGVSLDETADTELQRRVWTLNLQTEDGFERGSSALHDWGVHRGSGLCVAADGPLEVGTNVAMAAPLPIGFVDVSCRVVEVIDEADRFGFAYGTLSVHPEQGEESFMLRREPGGSVTFVVAAASQPAHRLARLVPPVAHRLQDIACRRYLAAMRHAVET